MKLELNRESAEALYQLAEELPAAMSEVVEGTVGLINVYQSVADSIGPHREQFLEMANQVRVLVGDQNDSATELARIFKECADAIMDFVETAPAQPQHVLKMR